MRVFEGGDAEGRAGNKGLTRASGLKDPNRNSHKSEAGLALEKPASG